ncbi:serine dehydratase subunit alpha family protein [Peptoniphilus sp.]|uniref:L-cysteine desulfidase family protein n=1 Tax=Peptoniphilus sp. TaxID=1971214 RepID=UPI002A80D499|nr:L-serine ammonia-lyase, iron-sulfur-dependent, subunit alpha [Peptoniphilus sp.]MDY3902537.1 L-serine ammonia-lyase, iron-sulfur-dependent, subunit alpha [Peptoniphilus sp.]
MDYNDFLREKMVPAFGCTEPIALAYGASRARSILGEDPEKITAKLSGNMIKNVNSVKVPGTDGRKGIEISLAAGAFLGDYNKKLEVLSSVDKSKLNMLDDLIKKGLVKIELVHDIKGLYIDIIMEKNGNKSRVVIKDYHTNIIYESINDKVLFENKNEDEEPEDKIDLSFDKIYDFAKNGDYKSITDVLDKEIEYNYAIAVEGIENPWGANIGKMILEDAKDNYNDKLVAYAAAGSDARMSGCEKPVVINSGSGNQGITVSVPIIIYAKDHNIERDKLYRSLIFANLIGLYIKEGIGELSAYCGVVSAAASSVCGIAFMKDEDEDLIKEILKNALATNSGIICDGAKESCAIKIASSLKMSLLAYKQAKSGNSFKSGDGIVKSDVDDMIKTVGHIAKDGMRETDEVILKEMIGK